MERCLAAFHNLRTAAMRMLGGTHPDLSPGRHKYFEHVKSYKLSFSEDGATWNFYRDGDEEKVRKARAMAKHFLLAVPGSVHLSLEHLAI